MKEYFINNFYEFEGIFRLLLAAILGGVMGLERTSKRREAGFRTYMLVAIGSAMTVLAGEIMFANTGSADTTRIASAAVSGIGFIGAGSIIVSRSNRVKGLTTAAGIWVSVSVGIAIGCGYYLGGVSLVAIEIIVTTWGETLQARFLAHSKTLRMTVVFRDEAFILPFIEGLQAQGYEVYNMEITKPIQSCISVSLFLHVPNRGHDEILSAIRACDGVVCVMND